MKALPVAPVRGKQFGVLRADLTQIAAVGAHIRETLLSRIDTPINQLPDLSDKTEVSIGGIINAARPAAG